MKKTITLRELCARSGVSRRAVQGFESVGLLKPCGRNKYGHLLYEEEMAIRAERIRFLQDLGFSVKEITALGRLSLAEQRDAINRSIAVLELRRTKLSVVLERARRLALELECKMKEEENENTVSYNR